MCCTEADIKFRKITVYVSLSHGIWQPKSKARAGCRNFFFQNNAYHLSKRKQYINIKYLNKLIFYHSNITYRYTTDVVCVCDRMKRLTIHSESKKYAAVHSFIIFDKY